MSGYAIAIRYSSSSSSNGTNDGACVVGGALPSSSDNLNSPWPTKTHISIAGNDTSFPAFKDCCLGYPVQFIPPCTLWCQVADSHNYSDTAACWDKYDFHPASVRGGPGVPGTQTGSVDVKRTAGIAVGVACSLTLLLVLAVWLWCPRRGQKPAVVLPATQQLGSGGLKDGAKSANDGGAEMGYDEDKLRYSSDNSSRESFASKV
ncbi:uncharacterized protein B0I36DRAFT_350449 [Microdochium trichocladiopsis]|uniref:Uncharacterized protein n=1 Tax=Microdochium trichocladiopsis TaxID=1682393 RepID=A0A9P8Y5B6_9PEZI|nr:uncharacterized protein B0I36DRAFT_350449 [Microdochium trichocladiopsis]KAH7029600.1 hypothetical protein B0I36DRAFT_350449 [Microdochium trichocladiopsis]